MRAYRVVWLFLCGVLGVVGSVIAFTWSLPSIIMLFVVAAFAGGVAALVALDPADTTRLPRDKRRMAVTSSVLAGAGTVAFVGLATLLGAPTAVLLLAITAGGSPYAIRHCLQWLARHEHLPTASPQPAEPEQGAAIESDREAMPEVAPASLSDDALCLAWRASFSALLRADSPSQRLRVVEERRAYLDELERRNAKGMAAWLASGARAAGDPSRFVLGDSVAGRAPIDWDGLIHGTDK
jgi:hypothetical protein